MDLPAPFRFHGPAERRKAPRPTARSEKPVEHEERPRYVTLIPIIVPLFAVVLAALVYYIFWVSWSY